MSPRMTSAEYAIYQANREPKQAPLIPTQDETEGELHDMIESWCRRQDPPVPYGHARMDKKSTYTAGWPDFTILLPGGRLLLVECKSATGDLSEDQKIFKGHAESVQHEIHVVRSYPEFLMIVKSVMTL